MPGRRPCCDFPLTSVVFLPPTQKQVTPRPPLGGPHSPSLTPCLPTSFFTFICVSSRISPSGYRTLVREARCLLGDDSLRFSNSQM